MAGLLDQEENEGADGDVVDPTEDMYIKTLSSFKFLIDFSELQFHKKRDIIQKACP